MELLVKNIADLDEVVRQLLVFAGHRRKLAFTGEVGAGKTALIQAFCRHLGVREHVTSPTYALINEYTYEENGEDRLVHHLDLYRLQHPEEALDIGIEEHLFGEDFCLIEWPELIEDFLPADTVRINIEIEEDSSRKIIFL